MNTFNSNFYQSNRNYTKEMAEARLVELGYKNFTFKSVSYTNGASFYFESEDGKDLRVSDHPLTGNRSFETIQIDIVPVKKLDTPFKIRDKYVAGEISKKEYKTICKERGFIYKP